jgi:hypothetical protein
MENQGEKSFLRFAPVSTEPCVSTFHSADFLDVVGSKLLGRLVILSGSVCAANRWAAESATQQPALPWNSLPSFPSSLLTIFQKVSLSAVQKSSTTEVCKMISWFTGVACVLTSLFCDTGFPDGQQSLHRPSQWPNVVDSHHAGQPSVTDTENLAKIVLYPGSRTYPDDLRNLGIDTATCADEDGTETVHLDTDVCLSGEYYVRDNIKITQSPRCSDGSSPKFMFYPNRFCTGSTIQATGNHSIGDTTGRCLWSTKEVPVPSYYWSLAFRCASKANSTIVHHQTAQPAVLHNNISGMVPGRIANHGSMVDVCEDKWYTQNRATFQLKPDKAMRVFSYPPLKSFEISAPAICANGTRARFAMLENESEWPTDLEKGFWVMDVDDAMIGTRIKATGLELKRGGLGNADTFMFLCEGRGVESQQNETAEPPGPRISTNECPSRPSRFQWVDSVRPPTFIYPRPMTCVNLPKNQQLRVSEKNPECPDGRDARLATWQEPNCQGKPSQLTSFRNLQCTSPNLWADTSYMVWCGRGRNKEPEQIEEEEPRPEDDPRAFVSTDDCPSLRKPEPGWIVVSTSRPHTIPQMIPDRDCNIIWPDYQLMVYKNARCANNATAKVEVYDGKCCGTPRRIFDVEELVDTCTQLCEEDCYYKFTCETT